MLDDAAIEIKDLCKSFDGGREYVLNGVNLMIPKGSLTVIIGYSGTGKSVLLKHMLGLLKPSSGSVKVLGKNLWELTEEDLVKLRCSFGVLFQHAALFDDLT
ncbi:MAG: ATP-binding cassette domain-containing protein, partial [Bdellovibrionales bacterium]|nr:ATP-binding cassette domain-containing protein [Bdellovibrionales bacterium]